jgi:hypothetical protein
VKKKIAFIGTRMIEVPPGGDVTGSGGQDIKWK